MFKYNWLLSDGYPAKGIEKHNKTVFSCFSCGWGGTMGYKLAGYNVLGCCEIDNKIIETYKQNHHPKYAFNCDIRELINKDLPQDLFNLDILDGSPPCSVFSTAGKREEGWGKEKISSFVLDSLDIKDTINQKSAYLKGYFIALDRLNQEEKIIDISFNRYMAGAVNG